MNYAKITGIGCFAPEKVYDNEYMESIVETNDEWIMQRTGIKRRHIAEDDIFTTDIATKAAENAIKDAGLTSDQIDLIILATVTPDYFTPSCSCVVQKNLGANRAAAFDVNAACSGFVTGLTIAKQFVENGRCEHVLVIGADALSKATDYKDRGTCILFGDAAGAVVISKSDKKGIISEEIGAKGEDGDKLTLLAFRHDMDEVEKRVSHNPHTIWMAGAEVMKFAVKAMESAARNVAEKAGLDISEVDLIIPHQANKRIIDGAAKRMGIDLSKVFVNLEEYGNTSSASIPVALAEAVATGRAKKGDKIILVGFGGGLTWGATLIEL